HFTPVDNGDGKPGDQRTGGNYENMVGIAANYSADFDGFNVLVGAGYLFGEAVAGGDDYKAYDIGLNVGFGGFTVGAAYVAITEWADLVVEEVDTIQLGATYEFDAWTFGANAALTTED